jgi:hypothetical protein
MKTKTKPKIDLYTIDPVTHDINMNFHIGQWRAWNSMRRFIGVFAGTQGGKTSWLPWWLHREIKICGPGDYLAVTSTFDLFKLKFLPTIREVFEKVLRIGRYWSGDRVMEIMDPSTGRFLAKRADDTMYARIILRSAQAGSGLESTTAKAAILDEAGQKEYTEETWEAINRRLALNSGRACIGTTIYNFGWLKEQFYDRWKSGDKDFDVFQFDSTVNPNFPKKEFRRAKKIMPLWRFNMFYRGLFERPAGLIYDSFNEDICKIKRFDIPYDWERYVGLDFGGVNTAATFYAKNPISGQFVLYRQYRAGNRTAKQHVKFMLDGEPSITKCVGGSHSEGQWRAEFAAAGLHVKEPDIREVEIGIARVYGAHKQNQILVFEDLDLYLKEKKAYSRKLDAAGQPTEDIEDKNTYHLLDSERYIIGWLKRPRQRPENAAGEPRTNFIGSLDRGPAWQVA